jgi:ADP-heptose:LPS heptosyltransferase
MDRILVLNLTRMGDLLQSTPLISGLKARHPNAELGLLSQEAFASTARLLPCVDRVLSLDQDQAVGMLMDDRQALGRRVAWFQEHLRPLRGAGWDLVLNLSHSRDSAVLARLLSRKEVRGIALDSGGRTGVMHEWARYFFCVTGNRAVNQLNLVDIYRRMGDLEGHEGGMAMKIGAQARETVEASRDAFAHGKPLVLVQAGASRENRRWPLDRMVEVMRALHDRASCAFALTGSGGERELCQALAGKLPDLPVLNLAGRTSVEELGAWCRRADLLITNDTGTLHVAAANGLPSVSLFIATALPWETAPWLPGCLVLHAQMDCAPCSHHVVCPHVQCRDRIALETVRDAALLLLSRKGLAEAPQREWARRPGSRVYETFRDEAGWLDLQEHGCPDVGLSVMAGRAFRHLWLGRLERPSAKPQPLPRCGAKGPVGSQGLEVLMERLDEVRREAARARRLVEEIHQELAGAPGKASRLETLARRLGEADDRLFELELGQPLLRPLGVLHRMAKEELQVLADMESLGRATAACYAELEARCQLLALLLLKSDSPQAGPGWGGRVTEERTESCASL